MVYRKVIGKDTWHFMLTCQHWPGHTFDEQTLKKGLRPVGGELCDECLGKEKVDKKRNKWKKRERA